MSSFWPITCRIFVGIEGCLGVLLNFLVVALIWRKKLASNMATYRVGVTVTAMQGALQNGLAALSCQVHLFHYDQYIIVMYGPVAWASEMVSDVLLFLFVMAAFGIWELIPSSCILQYLALMRSHYSSTRRLLIAYGVCFLLVAYSIPFCSTFHAPSQVRQELMKTVQEVHQLDANYSVRVYGGFLNSKYTNDRSVLSLAIYCVFPTYLVGYIIFVFTSRRCHQTLTAFGDIRSAQTLALQKKFFRMIILQALLPLAILSLPLGLFGFAIISGMAMDLLTLGLSFSLWLVPIVQALVSLSFVIRIRPAIRLSKDGPSLVGRGPITPKHTSNEN